MFNKYTTSLLNIFLIDFGDYNMSQFEMKPYYDIKRNTKMKSSILTSS